MTYIEREVLEATLNERLDFLRGEYGDYDHYTDGFEEAVVRVEEALAVDVVKVVRCKDCKYYCHGILDYCENNSGLVVVRPNEFCSYGVKRED